MNIAILCLCRKLCCDDQIFILKTMLCYDFQRSMCHVQVLAKILRLTGTSVTKEDSLCSPHCKVSSRIYHNFHFESIFKIMKIFLQVSPPHASQQEARMLKSRFCTFYFTHFQLLFSASAEVFIFIPCVLLLLLCPI